MNYSIIISQKDYIYIYFSLQAISWETEPNMKEFLWDIHLMNYSNELSFYF